MDGGAFKLKWTLFTEAIDCEAAGDQRGLMAGSVRKKLRQEADIWIDYAKRAERGSSNHCIEPASANSSL
jgi:hypothetical protein